MAAWAPKFWEQAGGRHDVRRSWAAKFWECESPREKQSPRPRVQDPTSQREERTITVHVLQS